MTSATYNTGHNPSFTRHDPLSRLGLNIELVLIGLGAIVLAFIIISSGGSRFKPLAFLSVIFFLALTVYRIDWGFYIFFAAVLVNDQFAPTEFAWRLITTKIQYFANIKYVAYLPSISSGVMTIMEIHLLLLFSIWLITGILKQKIRWNQIGARGAVLLLFAALAGWLIYGMQTGGVFLNALWEIRALCYLPVFIFFVPQIMHTKTHVKTLMWILILTLTFKAIQAYYIYARVYWYSFKGVQAFTSHEDPVFILLVFALLIGLILFQGHRKQLLVILLLLIPLCLGFYIGQRRAAYAAIGTTGAVFVVTLTRKDLWRFLVPFLPMFVGTAFYLVIFWNSYSPYASFAQTIKSGLITDKDQMSTQDYYSNLYRDIEKYNLAMTVRRVPFFGVGYGNKYDQPIKSLVLWSLDGYIPHNLILNLLVKTGAVGFFCFWFFFNAVLFYGAATYPKLRDPYLKAVCIVAMAAVLNQVVVSYFDLQLTYTRNMVLLGTLIGLLLRLKVMDTETGEPSPQISEA